MDFTGTRLPSFALAAVIITLPFIPSASPASVLYGFEQTVYTLYALIVLLVVMLIYGFRKKEERIRKINGIDLILMLALIACLLQVIFIRKWQIDPVWLFKYGALVLTYIIARNLTSHMLIYQAILFSGCLQSCISLGQYFGMIASRHALFPVTGTFDNPGPLGGYLTISLIIGTLLLTDHLKQKHYPELFLYLSGVLLVGMVLFITSSRAAWLSVGIAFFYFLYQRFFTDIRPGYKKVFFLAAFVGMVSGGKLLYDIQPESAKARLLVWQVSATMMAERPICGHGIGAFGEKYMVYQAKYFENNPASSFALVADNPLYAYNEIIHIGIEQGAAALLIVFTLLYTLFINKYTRCPENSIPLTTILGWFVFCLFSYPSDVFPLLIILPILIAFVEFKPCIKIPINRKVIIIGIGTLAGLSATTLHFHHRAYYLSALMNTGSGIEGRKEISDRDLSLFIHHQRIKTVLTAHAGKYDNKLYEKLEKVAGSYDSFMHLGDLYMMKGAYKKAEYYYRMASYMIPNRIRPNYCLWKLAIETHNQEKAIEYADKIVGQQVKISNTFTLKTKYQMMRFLNKPETTP